MFEDVGLDAAVGQTDDGGYYVVVAVGGDRVAEVFAGCGVAVAFQAE